MKKTFIEKNFRHASLVLIEKCDAILTKFADDGYDMTLRQLYYQLVSADEIENKKESYDNLGGLMTDARLAGYIDWNHLVDRGRNLVSWAAYESPQSRIKLAAYGYGIDKWKGQKYRPEVWIEKEALSGVFDRICGELDIPYFACKGYTSSSEMYAAGQRLAGYIRKGQQPIIFHFGDHDPSGIDMTRDVLDRLQMFMGGAEVKRMALNMPQIEQYQPPPNFAKVTDSRFRTYQEKFGDESWELDALNPKTLSDLVRGAVMAIRNEDKWKEAVEQEETDIKRIHQIADSFSSVVKYLDDFQPAADVEDDFYNVCAGDENCYNSVKDEGEVCADCQLLEENSENNED